MKHHLELQYQVIGADGKNSVTRKVLLAEKEEDDDDDSDEDSLDTTNYSGRSMKGIIGSVFFGFSRLCLV